MVRRLRKTKKNQTYNYDRNRKRMSFKDRRNGIVKCPDIRRAYDRRKVPSTNIQEMGLSYDVNETIPIPKVKDHFKLLNELSGQTDDEEEVQKPEPTARPKQYVADELERDAKEFSGVRFRLPRSQVRQITTMIDRYGFNYHDMASDRRNYEQETWRQFRAKIRKFLKLPAQCTPYLEQKGWLDCDMSDPNDPRWKEFDTDDES